MDRMEFSRGWIRGMNAVQDDTFEAARKSAPRIRSKHTRDYHAGYMAAIDHMKGLVTKGVRLADRIGLTDQYKGFHGQSSFSHPKPKPAYESIERREKISKLEQLMEEMSGAPSDTSFWTGKEAENPRSAKAVVDAADKARGELIGFKGATGHWFQIKKKKPGTYFLAGASRGRSRWGNKREIMDDVSHVLEYGTLPQPGPKMW